MYVFVVLISPPNQCLWCDKLLLIFDDIVKEILKVDPTLKFPEGKPAPIVMKGQYPKLQKFYQLWKPIILLIPVTSWENGSMDHTIIMNSENGEWKPKWDTTKPEQFGLWLKEVLGIKTQRDYIELNKCDNVLNLVSR